MSLQRLALLARLRLALLACGYAHGLDLLETNTERLGRLGEVADFVAPLGAFDGIVELALLEIVDPLRQLGQWRRDLGCRNPVGHGDPACDGANTAQDHRPERARPGPLARLGKVRQLTHRLGAVLHDELHGLSELCRELGVDSVVGPDGLAWIRRREERLHVGADASDDRAERAGGGHAALDVVGAQLLAMATQRRFARPQVLGGIAGYASPADLDLLQRLFDGKDLLADVEDREHPRGREIGGGDRRVHRRGGGRRNHHKRDDGHAHDPNDGENAQKY